MATMNDALAVLAKHPRGILSGAVADQLWPGGAEHRSSGRWNKPHHGGPTGGQRAAAGLLGRMQRRGLVIGGRQVDGRGDDPRTWWRLTEAGRAALAPINE